MNSDVAVLFILRYALYNDILYLLLATTASSPHDLFQPNFFLSCAKQCFSYFFQIFCVIFQFYLKILLSYQLSWTIHINNLNSKHPTLHSILFLQIYPSIATVFLILHLLWFPSFLSFTYCSGVCFFSY